MYHNPGYGGGPGIGGKYGGPVGGGGYEAQRNPGVDSDIIKLEMESVPKKAGVGGGGYPVAGMQDDEVAREIKKHEAKMSNKNSFLECIPALKDDPEGRRGKKTPKTPLSHSSKT